MQVRGIGVDILRTSRINQFFERGMGKRLAMRILSEYEQILFDHSNEKERFLANRWASKEAVYKAVFPTHRLQWKEVSVISKGKLLLSNSAYYLDNKPILILPKHVNGIAHLSISHDGEYTVAYVVYCS